MPHRALIVNMLGGPGVGKTTLAADLFVHLKHMGVNVEYVQEYAKKLVWQQRWFDLDNQFGVSLKQYQLLRAVADDVDCVVTDGPLAHGLYYVDGNKDCVSDSTKTKEALRRWIGEFDSFNVLVRRHLGPSYSEAGRYQTAHEAMGVAEAISKMIEAEEVQIDIEANAFDGSIGAVTSAVVEELRARRKP
jgi:hypothetical protein